MYPARTCPSRKAGLTRGCAANRGRSHTLFSDEVLRPISKAATLNCEGGELRITLVNCYPALGDAEVEVLSGGQVIERLVTSDRLERTVTVPEGLWIQSPRIFDADENGQ